MNMISSVTELFRSQPGRLVCLFMLLLTHSTCRGSQETDVQSGLRFATEGADECRRVREYRVTSLADDGKRGTLRHAVHVERRSKRDSRRKSCRRVSFDIEGTITLRARRERPADAEETRP